MPFGSILHKQNVLHFSGLPPLPGERRLEPFFNPFPIDAHPELAVLHEITGFIF
jgi:hypothetical protein